MAAHRACLTIEDVIEEIVGEIRDEYDAAEEAPFTRISENEAVFNGSVSMNEFNDAFGVELPTEESDTLGGLIYTQLGRLPRVGDRVRIGQCRTHSDGIERSADQTGARSETAHRNHRLPPNKMKKINLNKLLRHAGRCVNAPMRRIPIIRWARQF